MIEERILNPFAMHCKCAKLSDAELNHFLLIGDKRMAQIMEEREWCIQEGLLKNKFKSEIKNPEEIKVSGE